MKFSLFATKGFLPYIIKHLENDGHEVLFNKFSPDIDICIIENRYYLYDWYRALKVIRKNKIKLINIVNDIPFVYFQKGNSINSITKNIQQFLFNITNKNFLLYQYVNKPIKEKRKKFNDNYYLGLLDAYINTFIGNRQFFQLNYRGYLKKADLNLAVSKYTQRCVRKFLKLDVEVCHQCVNSEYLLSLPREEIKYDAVNISRIVKHKNQKVFVDAANKLGLNILVLGRYDDRTIILNCPHKFVKDNKKLFKILNQSYFYVDCSLFEGFGMTPVEAAYLNKISIVSDTYVHRDVLGSYPVYFNGNSIEDLIDKMKLVLDGRIKPKTDEIKKKYSSLTFTKRLMTHIESII